MFSGSEESYAADVPAVWLATPVYGVDAVLLTSLLDCVTCVLVPRVAAVGAIVHSLPLWLIYSHIQSLYG